MDGLGFFVPDSRTWPAKEGQMLPLLHLLHEFFIHRRDQDGRTPLSGQSRQSEPVPPLEGYQALTFRPSLSALLEGQLSYPSSRSSSFAYRCFRPGASDRTERKRRLTCGNDLSAEEAREIQKQMRDATWTRANSTGCLCLVWLQVLSYTLASWG